MVVLAAVLALAALLFSLARWHRGGPHFLNVLRVCDIPEALGLLAPDVKLTLVGKNAKDKAFDRTAALYKAAGVADKFKRE